MNKGVIVVHREKDEIASPQNSKQRREGGNKNKNFEDDLEEEESLSIELNYKKNKRSPLLEDSLKAVIEETEEELEDASLFESVQITKRDSKNSIKFNQSNPKNINNPCFLFQPDLKVQNKRETLLPKKEKKNIGKMTLVLDLDETLVHFCEVPNDDPEDPSKTKHLFLVRPYVSTFLSSCSKYYEIVIFTASVKNYADYILDILDPEKEFISHRLYREDCDFRDDCYIKDLSRLGRELSETLIVDNNAGNFQLQPDNGILIKSWYGEEGDQALKNLGPLLEEIALSDEEDVRVCMKRIGDRYHADCDRS